MVTFSLVAIESVIILLLLYALIQGQPAAALADRNMVVVQATENAALRASRNMPPLPPPPTLTPRTR